jgi:MFS family permease
MTISPPTSVPRTAVTRRYALSSFQSGLVVSMSLLGALLGSLIALASGNKLGRRTELLMSAVLYGAPHVELLLCRGQACSHLWRCSSAGAGTKLHC